MSVSMRETKSQGSTKTNNRKNSRRTRTENLEKEVELIMSQEDDSDHEMEMEIEISKENQVPGTPKKTEGVGHFPQTPSSRRIENLNQTPRRSARKSIKPVQEYEDIVSCKRQLRSAAKIDVENTELVVEEQQAKWTPAKVGRVSQKRGRKSRKTAGDKSKSKALSGNESQDIVGVNKLQDDNDKPDIDSQDENNLHNEHEDQIIISGVESNVVEDSTFKNEENIKKEGKKINIVNSDAIEEGVKQNLNLDAKGTNVIDTEVYIIESKNMSHTEDNGKESFIDEEESALNETFEKDNIVDVGDDKGQENGFGTYLKSNNLDISDLGLNPLNEDVNLIDDLPNTEHKTDKITEAKENNKIAFPVVTIMDDTLNSSDCILVNANVEEKTEDDMQPLRLSDDETPSSPLSKAPRIILTTDEGEDQTLNSSTLLNEGTTPKRYSKTAMRMPTPYKPKTDHLINEVDMDQEDSEPEVPSITIEVSKMEPKEIVVNSIRKRSWSVCIGGAEVQNKRKNVTFYSPANQTTILEDLDERIVQSVKKIAKGKSDTDGAFITQRRKRSMSFDEAMINKSKCRNQTPGKIGVTPQKVKPARTKLPNFAAIHQKNFEKMENLVEHVNRKAERAKILTNSATKARATSAQKPAKSQQVSSSTATVSEKPKAVKRINLQTTETSTFSIAGHMPMQKTTHTPRKETQESKLPVPRIAICKPISVPEITHNENCEVNLPNPRRGIIKPHTITNASGKNKQMTPGKNVLKPTQSRQAGQRPAFNLSTALESSQANIAKPINTIGGQSTAAVVAKANATKTTTQAPTISFDEKMASRRQRRMDMFKGRGASTRTTPGTAEKNFGNLIRGVRSNRRFELQMAHRKNMEH
uniref:Uncharacterized protein n=2 Tax=Ceratitis capitata TaxID=7213 RepID=W8BEY8_CERCA